MIEKEKNKHSSLLGRPPGSIYPGEEHPIREMTPFFAAISAARICGISFFIDSSVLMRIDECLPAFIPGRDAEEGFNSIFQGG